jgi:hypothetical protein
MEKGISQLMPNSYPTAGDFAVGVSLRFYRALAPRCRIFESWHKLCFLLAGGLLALLKLALSSHLGSTELIVVVILIDLFSHRIHSRLRQL